MDTIFTDCGSASVAVQTAAIALTATALAVAAFCLAYIAKTVRGWRAWLGSGPNPPPSNDA